jgi:RND family efflux transporter MFP subunit
MIVQRRSSIARLLALFMALFVSRGAQAQTDAQVYECLIEPYAVVRVASSVDGVIDEVLVAPGKAVEKGDIIARLHSEIERKNLELARARAEYDGTVELRDVQAQFAQRKLERAQKLAGRDVVSDSALDESATEANVAEMAVTEAQFDKTIAELELARAKALLEQKVIRSPINGIVTERLLWPGEYAHEQAQVVTLAQLDPLEVRVFIPTGQYGRIQPGQLAKVRPEAPVGGEYVAEVETVDMVFDAASDTFGVRLKLPNPDHHLPAGLRCLLEFAEPGDDLVRRD